MRIRDIETDKELDLPKLEVGDEIRLGKFRNQKAEIIDIKDADTKRPQVKTTKGTKNLFTFDLDDKEQ